MSDTGDVTLGELKRMMESQNKTLEEIKGDVKKQNGRVGSLESAVAVHTSKITNLDREVFNRRRQQRRVAEGDVADDDGKGITRRDWAMFTAGGIALTGAVVFIWKLLPFLLAGPKP
jgi:hypothetical protein